MKQVVYFLLLYFPVFAFAQIKFEDRVFEAGHESLRDWRLPEVAPYPEGNKPNEARVHLGKMLFFDPRMSRDGNMSCATCHNPSFGWSDALPVGKGFRGTVLGRATPTIINTAFNSIQMWDGRKMTLEDQAMGPMESKDEMNTDISDLILFLKSNKGYQDAFAKAYPGEGISESTISKAIASFERTVISNNSRFDRWVNGEKGALSATEVEGFRVFMDPAKGNCAVCHAPPNFTDNGFHNIGLASFGDANPDLGRYSEKPINLMKGAFKTPTIRDISDTAPYFHDGSAANLRAVIDHYVDGGVVKSNLSPNLKPVSLDESEKHALEAFMHSLSSEKREVTLPTLPL